MGCTAKRPLNRAGHGPAGDPFPRNGCWEGPMLLVQSFSEPLLTEGVKQLHKNLWEAGGSETGPWLNEGKFTQLL